GRRWPSSSPPQSASSSPATPHPQPMHRPSSPPLSTPSPPVNPLSISSRHRHRYAENMTSDADDALSWDGDDDLPAQKPDPAPALPRGWKAVGRDAESVGRIEDDGTVTPPDEPSPLSTPMLVL